MPAWDVVGPSVGSCKSWRDIHPELQAAVTRVIAPKGRGIAWEGTEIWAYRERASNIAEVFASNVRSFPNEEAYVFYPGGQRLTWSQAGARANRVASRLRRDFGVKKRDRVCLLTLGCPEYVITYLALQKLGAIAVPVNLGLTGEGLAAQINRVEAKVLLVSNEVWSSKLAAVRSTLQSVETVFLADESLDELKPESSDGSSDTSGRNSDHNSGRTQTPAGLESFASLNREGFEPEVNEAIDEWDLCAISFTSGTTGLPKGTMAMHINALGCAQNFVHVSKDLVQKDINLCMPPLYHNTAVYADFMPALLTGGKCVIMAAFAPLEALQLIERERVTWAVAAPIMLWMMMNHADFKRYDVSSLKKILFGGHAASETYINQLAQCFNPSVMVNGGSVSESTALGFALPTEDALRKITSCGLSTPNTDIAIFDDQGKEVLEPNVIGEVAYRGQQTNAGYWNDPAKTAEVFRRDGFVLSGDWAKIDEEGYLWLLDRKKDMVVRGGQNVYCIEVENKLYLHPAVLRAAVVGVPDHVFSERLKAVLVLKPGHQLSADEMRAHCKQHLAAYEVPEYIVFTSALPTNAAGKTLKPPLIDQWAEPGSSAMAQFEAFIKSLPAPLLEIAHFRFQGQPLSPSKALEEFRQGSELGKSLLAWIAEHGLVSLMKPDESRFR
jgi:long-chain acyl-CoA synthetase